MQNAAQGREIERLQHILRRNEHQLHVITKDRDVLRRQLKTTHNLLAVAQGRSRGTTPRQSAYPASAPVSTRGTRAAAFTFSLGRGRGRGGAVIPSPAAVSAARAGTRGGGHPGPKKEAFRFKPLGTEAVVEPKQQGKLPEPTAKQMAKMRRRVRRGLPAMNPHYNCRKVTKEEVEATM